MSLSGWRRVLAWLVCRPLFLSAGGSMIAFSCPACGAPLKVKEELAGKSGKCPGCGNSVIVPRPATPRSATAPSPSGSGSKPPVSLEETAAPAANGGRSTAHPKPPSAPGGDPSLDCSFLSPAQETDEIGRLGHYRVLRVLGIGGMGIVFEAEDTQLRRRVALKAMKPVMAATESNRLRFLREAQATAAIEHDHIVTIYQVGDERGVPFLAMKLLQGTSLEDRLIEEGGWLPIPDVLRIGREIAEGLAAAHARGLIHRDIKPANIWLEGDRGRVKIVDFGLARGANDDAGLTQEGMVLGTPYYMPPEQANGEPVDFRSDLFSLGCVLYRMATGQLPFPGKNTTAVLAALTSKDPEPPRAIESNVPAALSDLIMECLAKQPCRRPESATMVAEALERIEQDLAAGAATSPRRGPVEEEEPVELSPEEVEDVEVVEEETDEDDAVVARPKRKQKRRPPARGRGRSGGEREAGGLPWWMIVLIVVALMVIVGLVSFAFIRRALKSRDAAADRSLTVAARQR